MRLVPPLTGVDDELIELVENSHLAPNIDLHLLSDRLRPLLIRCCDFGLLPE